MADRKHNPFESPTCSIAEAILWVAYRDVARIRDAPSLFSLQQWPDAVTKEGLWPLLRELAQERQTIASFYSFDFPSWRRIGPAYYREQWRRLEAAEAEIGRTATLPVRENLAHQIDGLEGMKVVRSVTRTFREFIRTVESVLGFIVIDTDSLTQTFPVPDSLPAPAEPEPEPARHSEEEEAAPPESERAPPAPGPEPEPKPVRERRPKMKRRQIQLAVALKKHKLENSPLSAAALAPVLEKKEPSLGEVAPSTLYVVRRDFKELIEQAEEQEPI
jgi:hypothetical protein